MNRVECVELKSDSHCMLDCAVELAVCSRLVSVDTKLHMQGGEDDDGDECNAWQPLPQAEVGLLSQP